MCTHVAVCVCSWVRSWSGWGWRWRLGTGCAAGLGSSDWGFRMEAGKLLCNFWVKSDFYMFEKSFKKNKTEENVTEDVTESLKY